MLVRPEPLEPYKIMDRGNKPLNLGGSLFVWTLIKSKILSASVFNDFMDVSIHGEYKHFRNISNNHYIDPMEMVPVYHLSQESDFLNSINTVNASISTQVSNFYISYECYNLGEIILSSINSSKENLFTFHPNIPKLGRQSIISIKWIFED